MDQDCGQIAWGVSSLMNIFIFSDLFYFYSVA